MAVQMRQELCMRTVTPLLAVCVLISTAGLQAQERELLKSGDRVRVYWLGRPRDMWDWHAPDVIGTVISLTSDSLTVLTWDRSNVELPLDSVGGIEVNRGEKSNVGKGMAYGAISGITAGIIVGVAAGQAKGGCSIGAFGDTDCRPLYAAAGVLLGGVTGTIVGGIVGALNKTERWEQVPLERLRLEPVAMFDGRFGLAVLVSF
jgi:hypothetical protein